MLSSAALSFNGVAISRPFLLTELPVIERGVGHELGDWYTRALLVHSTTHTTTGTRGSVHLARDCRLDVGRV